MEEVLHSGEGAVPVIREVGVPNVIESMNPAALSSPSCKLYLYSKAIDIAPQL